MKDKIVLTSNMTNFVAAVESLKGKPERIDRMGLIYGKWGLGKTTTIEWYFANNPCYYVRAVAGWIRSPVMALEDMLKAYRVEAAGKFRQDFRELVRVSRKSRHPLFIDEADRVVRKSILIETVRDLHDIARVPVILIGQENIIHTLQRRDLGQVFSRITEIVEYRELSSLDIQRIASELCELKCGAKVASFIRTITLGDFRLINSLLVKVEEMCLFNKETEITQGIAKEAAKTLHHSGDINQVFGKESNGEEGAPLAAVG